MGEEIEKGNGIEMVTEERQRRGVEVIRKEKIRKGTVSSISWGHLLLKF